MAVILFFGESSVRGSAGRVRLYWRTGVGTCREFGSVGRTLRQTQSHAREGAKSPNPEGLWMDSSLNLSCRDAEEYLSDYVLCPDQCLLRDEAWDCGASANF